MRVPVEIPSEILFTNVKGLVNMFLSSLTSSLINLSVLVKKVNKVNIFAKIIYSIYLYFHCIHWKSF